MHRWWSGSSARWGSASGAAPGGARGQAREPVLEIKAVDFAASAFSDVQGPSGGPMQSSVGGRAFVKVYAERRTTGEQFLLLYEDIARRRQPIQIIRFVRGTGGMQPDSTRSPDGGA